jgi:hypothetical protein
MDTHPRTSLAIRLNIRLAMTTDTMDPAGTTTMVMVTTQANIPMGAGLEDWFVLVIIPAIEFPSEIERPKA